MAEASHKNIKDKIQSVTKEVPNKSKDEVMLVLHYYDYSVEKTILAYLEDGAKVALQGWNKQQQKKWKNKKNEKASSEKATDKVIPTTSKTAMVENKENVANGEKTVPNGHLPLDGAKVALQEWNKQPNKKQKHKKKRKTSNEKAADKVIPTTSKTSVVENKENVANGEKTVPNGHLSLNYKEDDLSHSKEASELQHRLKSSLGLQNSAGRVSDVNHNGISDLGKFPTDASRRSLRLLRLLLNTDVLTSLEDLESEGEALEVIRERVRGHHMPVFHEEKHQETVQEGQAIGAECHEQGKDNGRSNLFSVLVLVIVFLLCFVGGFFGVFCCRSAISLEF